MPHIYYIYLTHFNYVDRNNTNFFEGEPLRALSTLAYSDNVDLQRSAALAFAEITEKGTLYYIYILHETKFLCF